MADGPNLYSYVTQNPWSKFDPEGLSWWSDFKDGASYVWNNPGQAFRNMPGHFTSGANRTFYGAVDATWNTAVSIPQGIGEIGHYASSKIGNENTLFKSLADYSSQTKDPVMKAGYYGKSDPIANSSKMVVESAESAVMLTKALDSGIDLAKKAYSALTFKNIGREGAGLIGVSEKEAAALARQVHGIPGVQSVEAFGSRAGSTYRGRPPTVTSDLDILVTLDSKIINSPSAMKAVHAELGEIGEMWQGAKGFPLQSVVEIDTLMPKVRAGLEQTPFIPLAPK